jgi:serine phosphatase RsbU (regulator of sigma subunit)
MLLVFGAYGQTERYRRLLIVAGVVATGSLAVCWTTDWVVAGVRETPSGMLYPRAGWWLVLHAGQLVIWPVIGLAIVRRTALDQPPRVRPWQVIALIGCAVAGASDVLLAQGVAGYYPLAWVAALGAVAVLMNMILRGDLLRTRGLDRDAALELVLVVATTAAVAVVAVALGDVHPLALSVIAAAVAVTAGGIAAVARARRAASAPDAGDDGRIDHLLGAARDAAAIEGVLAEAWRRYGVTEVRLWQADGIDLRAGTATAPLPGELAAWLVEHPGLIVRGDLPTSRLGSARPLVELLARTCGPDLVLPLVDRDQVLGVAGAELGPRSAVLRDPERVAIEQAATPAARALAYLALRREAEEAVLAARETEVADAVATQAGTRRRADLGDWRLAAAYRPAERVAGDVWSWERLPDGRLALLVADVAGRGVPAALVSSALAGAFAAVTAGWAAQERGPGGHSDGGSGSAAAGGGAEPAAVAALLDRTIGALGKGEHQAAAFVAVCDPDRRVVDWVSAGHRGACVVRPGAVEAELSLLGGASSALGTAGGERASGQAPLGPGELLVVVSDGVIALRDARGQAWGERRFAQLLRSGALAAGDQAAPLILDAALQHAGGVAPIDDLLVIAVEPN